MTAAKKRSALQNLAQLPELYRLLYLLCPISMNRDLSDCAEALDKTHTTQDADTCQLIDTIMTRLGNMPSAIPRENGICLALANHPRAKTTLLVQMASNIIKREYCAPDKNLRTSQILLLHHLKNFERDIILAIAKHPNTPVKLQETIIHATDYAYHAALASNPSSPHNLLQQMSKHKEQCVRLMVAANPSTTPTILTTLAKDRSAVVRAGVAQNPNAPDEILQALAKQPHAHIQVALRTRKNVQMRRLENPSQAA